MALDQQMLLTFLVWCVAVISCFGEDSDIKQDTEFVFSIPKLLPYDDPPHVMITTSSHQPVYTTLSIPGYTVTIRRTISRNNGADIELPGDIRMNLGDGKQPKTIIVRASDTVSVYAIENELWNGDGFQAIPSQQLGTRYYAASYQPHGEGFRSFVCVSALKHSRTSVSILSKHSKSNFFLRPYESYRYDDGEDEDISGTLIQSDKPVAVISGSVPWIPETTAHSGGILSQLIPTESWGTLYYIFPFESLNSGFVYRVFVSNISTTLYMSDGKEIFIQPGGFFEGNVLGDAMVSFEADHAVMVTQYMKGATANSPRRGDPSMFVVPSVSSYTNNVTFPVFEYEYQKDTDLHAYYVNVISECDYVDGLLFDGASIASWNKLTTIDQTMCCVRSNVPVGYHSVTHANPTARFFVSVYAICEYQRGYCTSSYAYTTKGISALDVGSESLPTPPLMTPVTDLFLMATDSALPTKRSASKGKSDCHRGGSFHQMSTN